jgi:hypothetical protein
MNARKVVLGAWLAMIGLATIRRVTNPNTPGLPSPSVYLASGVVFSMLYGLSAVVPGLAAALAVGTDVGALMAPYLTGKIQAAPITTLNAWLSQLSGGQVAAVQSSGPHAA